ARVRRPPARSARRAPTSCRSPLLRTRTRDRSPRRRPAAPGSGARSSCPAHPAHRPQIAPGRALVPTRVVAHVAGADPAGELPRRLPRPLDLPPEGLVVQVVRPRVPGQRVVAAPEEPARTASPGERSVEAAERLDADEI